MPNYRRRRQGDRYFFTLVTHGRRRLFLEPNARDLLHEAIRAEQARRPFEMEAIVLLPDHLHMLWRLPPDDTDYSLRINLIKKHFTVVYLASGGKETVSPISQKRHRRRGVWQPRFWEHTIRDARDYHVHLDYIHMNAVKHGLVQCAADWPHSSFRRYVKSGWYEIDWAGRTDLPGNVEYVFPE